MFHRCEEACLGELRACGARPGSHPLAEQALGAFSAQSENVQLLQENWADVPDETRQALLEHLRYYADVLRFLEPAVEEEPAADEPEPEPTA